MHNTTQGAAQKTRISVSGIQAKTKHHKANNPQGVHSIAYATSYLWIQVRCSAGESHTLIQSSACLNPTNLWDLPSLQQCQCPYGTVICLTRTISSKLKEPAANEWKWELGPFILQPKFLPSRLRSVDSDFRDRLGHALCRTRGSVLRSVPARCIWPDHHRVEGALSSHPGFHYIFMGRLCLSHCPAR